MSVRLHPHALARLSERGCTEKEIVDTVQDGESITAKFGRQGFRRNFPFQAMWRGKWYATKQVELYAVQERDDWLELVSKVLFGPPPEGGGFMPPPSGGGVSTILE